MFTDELYSFDSQPREPRIPFGTLLEHGLLRPGQTLYFGTKGDHQATVLANGQLKHNETTGSIHAVGRAIQNAPCNGWENWYFDDSASGERLPINRLRAILRDAGHQPIAAPTGAAAVAKPKAERLPNAAKRAGRGRGQKTY
jgi:hypothetical protein